MPSKIAPEKKDSNSISAQDLRSIWKHLLFLLTAAACLMPFVSGPLALCLGMVVAIVASNPFAARTKRLAQYLLGISVVGLGAQMNVLSIGAIGLKGIGYTLTGIAATLVVGILLGRWLRVPPKLAGLLSAGTAICGGSAIAAVSPVIRAEDHEITVALATVFLLNAVALFIFPYLGQVLELSESQFGLWSALAIHDTSSVVGATLQYGPKAMVVGTTVKLARALWIVPVVLALGWLVNGKESDLGPRKIKIPWFIPGFLLAAACVTWLPELRPYGRDLASLAKRGFVVTLFLIGSGLSRASLRQVGARSFLHGLLLWFVVAGVSLVAVLNLWITVE